MEQRAQFKKFWPWKRRTIIIVVILLLFISLSLAAVQVYLNDRIRQIGCTHCNSTPEPTNPEDLAFYKRLQHGMEAPLAKEVQAKLLQITALPIEQISPARIEQVFAVTLRPNPENPLHKLEVKTDEMELAYWLGRFDFRLDMLPYRDVKRPSHQGLALPFGNCMDMPDLLSQLIKQGWAAPDPNAKPRSKKRDGGEPYYYPLFKGNARVEVIYERRSNCVLSVTMGNKAG